MRPWFSTSTPRVTHAPKRPAARAECNRRSFAPATGRLTIPIPSLTVPRASRRSAMDAVSGLTEALVDTVDSGVVDVFENQKAHRGGGQGAQGQVRQVCRVTLVGPHRPGFDAELREIGDFEGWIKAMEFDLNNLAGVMEDVAKQGAAPPSGTEGDER